MWRMCITNHQTAATMKKQDKSKWPFIAVIAPLRCANYLTAGKQYNVIQILEPVNIDKYGLFFTVESDSGAIMHTNQKNSIHLRGDDWIIVNN